MPLIRRMDKMWYISHWTIYYLFIKNNDIRKFEDKLMELETIILSEISQTQKDRYRIDSLMSGYQL